MIKSKTSSVFVSLVSLVPAGGHPSLLATLVAGNYLMAPTTTQELSFLPTVGLRVSRVQQDQFGVYTVHVNINKGGASDTETRSVTISRPELPSAIGGHLTAHVQPRAVYREDTKQWHTTREETVSSSSYSNGTFYLTLPNPVEGGDYTCSLNSTHHTTACLNLNPALVNGAAVKVDSAQAQFAVLEGRLEALQEENRELRQTDRTLQQQVNTLQEQNANLTSQLQGQQLNPGTGDMCVECFSTTPVLLHIGTNYPAGEGPIQLDNVVCNGNEASIFACAHNPVGTSDCSHNEDVGLSCWP
ncbi:hypothetical protein C0Q70_03485 [Pomacea canaliculata]|uniref:SRCR domain-containing protein n=1 Tax=Pomacea canaliculata TaxID=400727 RepID=A0A2T7PSV1_POMCA|nr:hypothetical protein C0Q70_03485 [Pomacea canaliculata]